jgi:sugar phosphate isomerase/epimerase
VFVAASTNCFCHLPLDAALERMVDLEYTCVEFLAHESGQHLKPSAILADLDGAIRTCRQTQLAKATKVVALTVRAAELGTPFNAEIERLRQLVAIASREGVVVGLLTETGRMTQDPDTAMALCDNVKGLAITLDPSHYTCGQSRPVSYEQLLKYVCHVRLRDSTKDKLQVRVGQGDIEYGRLVTHLNKYNYQRALCVDIAPMPDVDQSAEMRKMRLLLETLL